MRWRVWEESGVNLITVYMYEKFQRINKNEKLKI